MLGQACAHCPIFPTAASRRSLGRVSVPVWLVVLSDQLPIAGLVGHYPTNYLIGRRPLPRRLSALPLRAHAVLAPVSQGYPPPQGTFLRVTHPSATDGRSHPSDLHVLSMPPAFALSQDQTLRFIKAPQQQAQHPSPQHPNKQNPKNNPNPSCKKTSNHPATAPGQNHHPQQPAHTRQHSTPPSQRRPRIPPQTHQHHTTSTTTHQQRSPADQERNTTLRQQSPQPSHHQAASHTNTDYSQKTRYTVSRNGRASGRRRQKSHSTTPADQERRSFCDPSATRLAGLSPGRGVVDSSARCPRQHPAASPLGVAGLIPPRHRSVKPAPPPSVRRGVPARRPKPAPTRARRPSPCLRATSPRAGPAGCAG